MSLSRNLNILKTKSPNSKVLYSSKSTKDIFDRNGGSFNKSTIYFISSEDILFFCIIAIAGFCIFNVLNFSKNI